MFTDSAALPALIISLTNNLEPTPSLDTIYGVPTANNSRSLVLDPNSIYGILPSAKQLPVKSKILPTNAPHFDKYHIHRSMIHC